MTVSDMGKIYGKTVLAINEVDFRFDFMLVFLSKHKSNCNTWALILL